MTSELFSKMFIKASQNIWELILWGLAVYPFIYLLAIVLIYLSLAVSWPRNKPVEISVYVTFIVGFAIHASLILIHGFNPALAQYSAEMNLINSEDPLVVIGGFFTAFFMTWVPFVLLLIVDLELIRRCFKGSKKMDIYA